MKTQTSVTTTYTYFINNFYTLSDKHFKVDEISYTWSDENVKVDEIFYESLQGGGGQPNHNIICFATNPSQIICFATNPHSNKHSLFKSGNFSADIRTNQSQNEESSLIQYQYKRSPSLLHDIQQLKKKLEAPKYFYTIAVEIKQNGKQIVYKKIINLESKAPYRPTNLIKVNFETNGIYVTIKESFSCYKDYPDNLKICKQRLDHLQTFNPEIYYVFEMRKTRRLR